MTDRTDVYLYYSSINGWYKHFLPAVATVEAYVRIEEPPGQRVRNTEMEKSYLEGLLDLCYETL